MNKADGKYADLASKIISAFYEVYNELGYGFLEKVYHNALIIELKLRRFEVESLKHLKVYYKGHQVGD
jgi:GxxExxY protein